MSATASLAPLTLAVEPGQEATTELRVRNAGAIVDELEFSVMGDGAPWITVEPPAVSLFPQGEATVQVVFRPPASPAPPAGSMPYAVVVRCREDPTGSVAEEGTIEILPVASTTIELLPSVNRGRGGAKYQIAIDNRGNTAVESSLSFVDTTEQLRGAIELPVVRSEPGWASFTELQVKPRRRFWRGTSQTKPFQVVLETEGELPRSVDGSFLQEAVLPKWLGKALLALAALALVLLALWFLLMRPFVESSAEDAAKKEAAAAQETANQAKQSADAAGAAAQQAKDQADIAVTGTTAPPVVTTTTTTAPPPENTSFLLGGGAPTTFTVPAGKTLMVTDLVFGNPNGASGVIRLLRNGAVLFPINLANFRDLDYHYVTAIQVKAGETLSIDTAGTDASVFVSGELK